MESEQLHRAINGARAFAESLPPENQLRMTTVAEWDRLVDALEQAERSLSRAEQTIGSFAIDRGLVTQHELHGTQTSIGIGMWRIIRALNR